MQVVSIPYPELVVATTSSNKDDDTARKSKVAQKALLDKIGVAFGNSKSDEDGSLGILGVTDIPGMASLRQKVLPLAYQLGHGLSDEQREAITSAASGYSVGWSHGKERLSTGGYDEGKASFYANPLVDDLRAAIRARHRAQHKQRESESESQCVIEGVDDVSFFAPNVWPTQSLPQLEGVLKETAGAMRMVGIRLAILCDLYVKQMCPTYDDHKLESILRNSLYCKARLLHYYPPQHNDITKEQQHEDHFDNWCGWHNDHGTLTALLPSLYLHASTGTPAEPSQIPPHSGLHVKSRTTGKVVQVHVPQDYTKEGGGTVLFQIGETAQIHTGGILRATPHAVRAPQTTHDTNVKLTREALAVFMEPEYDQPMNLPPGRTMDDVIKEGRNGKKSFLPKTVSCLSERWTEEKVDGEGGKEETRVMNFGEFSRRTLAAFQ